MPRTFKCVDGEQMDCATCKYGACYITESCYYVYCIPCLDAVEYCPLHNPNGNCDKCNWEAKDGFKSK